MLAASRVHLKMGRGWAQSAEGRIIWKESGKVGQGPGHVKPSRPKDFGFILKAMKKIIWGFQEEVERCDKSDMIRNTFWRDYSSFNMENELGLKVEAGQGLCCRALGGTPPLYWVIFSDSVSGTQRAHQQYTLIQHAQCLLELCNVVMGEGAGLEGYGSSLGQR